MFPTQRTVRGAALAVSAALGLGGAVAPATLAPVTFASVARAQNHTPISSPNLPSVLTEHTDERRLRLEVLAQSGDYTLMALGGVSSLQDLQVRLVALSVEGTPVATMLLSPAQLTVSMSDEGYLELSIHQRLNIERGYMVEVINTRTGETASRKFVPEYGATLKELTASRQNIFFPDTPGLPPAVIIDANPTPEVSARPTPSPSASEDRPHPTAAPAPSTTDSPEPKAPRASEPVNPTPGLSPQPEASNLPVENPGEQSRDSDRLLVHPRPAPPQPEEAREATLTISTAELKGSADLQAINVSLQNVRESALGYDVMVFEMPPSGAAVGSPLDTVHVSPHQVHGGSFMTDLKVPGTSLVGGKRYRVVVVGGDSEEELRLLATASFAVSIIQRSIADNSFNPSQAPSAPGTVTVSDAQRPEYAPVENVSVGTWGWVTAPRISVLSVQSTLLRRNPVQDGLVQGGLLRRDPVQNVRGQVTSEAHPAPLGNGVFEQAEEALSPILSGYAALVNGRTVVNLLGYQPSRSPSESMVATAEGARTGIAGGFYTRGTKARGTAGSKNLEASAQESGPLPEGVIPLGIALGGSVAFVGSAVAVNAYRRRSGIDTVK